MSDIASVTDPAGLSDSPESDIQTGNPVVSVSDSPESDIQEGNVGSQLSDSGESDTQGGSADGLTRAQIHVGEPEGEPLLDAVDLIAGYIPGVNILNGASLTLHEGEIVGIIGPNGAGKSTSLTIAENMHMGAFQAPKLFNERFDYVCSIFPKLGQRKNQLAGQLSGGERQMVAMARALMMKPSVLLLDEPSAGLSPMLQDETFIRVRQVNKAGVSVVIVEQNARRCLQICDRGYVLDQGRNAYSGKGRDLMEDPKVVSLYLGNLEEEVEEEGR